MTLVKFNFFAPNTAEPMPTEYSWQLLSYVTLNWRHWDSKVRHLKFTWSSGSAHAKLVKFIPLSHHQECCQQFTHEPMVNPCFHVILANYYDAHTWFIMILFLMFLSLSIAMVKVIYKHIYIYMYNIVRLFWNDSVIPKILILWAACEVAILLPVRSQF